MAVTLEYHRAEDRMTIRLALPSGEVRTCWVTRRQWLFLILRLSEPAGLPAQIDGPTQARAESGASHRAATTDGPVRNGQTSPDSEASLAGQDVPLKSDAKTDQTVIVKHIGVVKTQQGLRISLRVIGSTADQSVSGAGEKINLNISSEEREILLATLSAKARQAGWDLDAGLKRLRSSQRVQKERPVIH